MDITKKGIGRSVRLDILAVDDDGKIYNIEFQRADDGASPERARFNTSIIDVSSLKPGQKFTELPEVYVNCEHQDSDTDLGKLVHDFLCRDSVSKYYYGALGERVSCLKSE